MPVWYAGLKKLSWAWQEGNLYTEENVQSTAQGLLEPKNKSINLGVTLWCQAWHCQFSSVRPDQAKDSYMNIKLWKGHQLQGKISLLPSKTKQKQK